MLTDYEYRYRITGQSFISPIGCTTGNSTDNGDGTITINDIPDENIATGDFQVRVKALGGNPPSAWLVSDIPFIKNLVTIFSFSQPDNMIVGDNQFLAIYTDGNYEHISVSSSDLSIATVSKIEGIWSVKTLSEGVVYLTASLEGFSEIVRNINVSSQFDDMEFNGFTVNPITEDGKLMVTEGSSAFNKYISFSIPTNDCNCELSVKFETLTAPESQSFGLGIGKKTINNWYNNASACSHMDLSFGGGNGGIRIWNISAINDSTSLYRDTFPIPCDVGDVMELTYKQIGNSVTFIGKNLTKDLYYEHSITNNLSTTKDFLIPNASKVCIWSFGGEWAITNIERKTNRVPNAKVTFIGDSKTFGYSAENYLNTFFSIVKDSFFGSSNNFGGDGDRTVEVLQTINESLRGVGQGQFVILCIGRNDLASSVGTSTWQSNYSNIVNTIKNTGATVIHLKNIPETTSFTAVNDYIDSEFPLDLKIDPSIGWDMGTMLSSDNIHPSAIGHQFVADLIIDSGYII